MGSYALLFALSLLLNWGDKGMLLLTLVVSGGIFVHIPDNGFYFWCIAIEIIVFGCAWKIKSMASSSILWLSAVLVIWHLLGLFDDGHREDSPYKVLVRFTEHAEFIMLILLSKHIFQNGEEYHV